MTPSDPPRGRLLARGGGLLESDDADPLQLPDLASRALRGSVIAASDEFFAEKENLINPGAPAFTPHTFGHKGQSTTGGRPGGGAAARCSGLLPGADEHDWVIVRLGAPGVVHAVVVDTAYFTGNFPRHARWKRAGDGYPDLAALESRAVVGDRLGPR